jgi:predicted lipid-binding transport protein (Tim44 family)
MWEVDMPQDVEVAGLIWLLWAGWVYWLISTCSQQASSQNRQDTPQGPAAIRASVAGDIRSSLSETRTPTPLENVVVEILRRDNVTTIEDFLADAARAYETVVAAFNAGDLATLRALLSDEVYDAFHDAIETRGTQEKTATILFSRIDPPQVLDGFIDSARMGVTLRFSAESFTLAQDATAEAHEHTSSGRETVDIWTFERMLSRSAATWRVTATGIGN